MGGQDGGFSPLFFIETKSAQPTFVDIMRGTIGRGMMAMNVWSGLVAALSVLLAGGLALAHGTVERKTEVSEASVRLFTADAATGELVVVDMPSGDVVSRLTTPPYIMSLGFSGNREHLFAMRGRSTDRDMVTVVSTGFFEGSETTKPPFVARTLSSNTPGGIREDHLATVGGQDAIFMEGSGEIMVLEGQAFTGLGGIASRTYDLAGPDHYHYLEAGDFLYVGHLRLGMLQILDRQTGQEATRLGNCPVLHGMIKDEPSGRLFFACANGVMVVGTRGDELNRDLGRITYPNRQRVGAFLKGIEGIYWGYTEGTIPQLYRLDVSQQPYTFTVLTIEASIRQSASPDGQYLLSLSKAGVLEIRSGYDGELLHDPLIATAVDEDLHEHVDKAILPDIDVVGDSAFVSLPHMGYIVEVSLQTGELVSEINVGGEPTRLIALDMTVD